MRLAKVSFVLLCLSFVFLPWLHGGELLHEYLFFAALFFILLALNALNDSDGLVNALTPVKWPLLFASFWLASLWLTVLPIGEQLFGLKSVAVGESHIDSIKNTSYIALFCLVVYLVNTKSRVKTLLYCIVASSTLMALYSLLNHYTNGQYELFSAIPPWGTKWSEAVRGTFSYKNHYGSYVAISLLLTACLLYARLRRSASGISAIFKSDAMLLIFASIILFTTLVKTSSRGSVLVFFIIVALALTAFIWNKRKAINAKRGLVGAAVAVITLFAFVQSATFERFFKDGLNPNGRDLMQHTVSEIWQHYAWQGAGSGSYPVIQHHYKDPQLAITAMSKRAHNDYLELLVTHGVLGLLFLTAFVVFCVRICLVKQSSVQKNKLELGVLAVIAYFALHSAVDFNFALPILSLLMITAIAILVRYDTRARKTGRVL